MERKGSGRKEVDPCASEGEPTFVLSRSLSRHHPVPAVGLYTATHPKKESVCHNTPLVFRLPGFGQESSHTLSSPSCMLLVFHYSASGWPQKTTRTSFLVVFHHFGLKMKLTKMKNSHIKKKSSKQTNKKGQTSRNSVDFNSASGFGQDVHSFLVLFFPVSSQVLCKKIPICFQSLTSL